MKHLFSGVLLSLLCVVPGEALAHNQNRNHHHHHHNHHNHCHDHPRKGIRHCHRHRRGQHHPRGRAYVPYYPFWFPHPEPAPVIEFNLDL